uniref:Uncharacterized protein n=1 Tax=Cucumis melo TaxID=3656 RepID=A0A9I9DVN6_CUCME
MEGNEVGMVGIDGKFGSAIVGSGGNASPFGSGGRLTFGIVGCGKFGRVGFGKAGNGGIPVGIAGRFGTKGGVVCKRWRAAWPKLMLERAKVAIKAMIKNFEEAIFFPLRR